MSTYCPTLMFRSSVDPSDRSDKLFPDQRDVFAERVRLAQEWAGYGQFNTATCVAGLYR